MFLQIKNIPKVSWSSEKPLNLKPKISTFFFLCFGLTLFGLGEGLLIVSASGASPWSVFAQGLYLNIGFSIGLMTILISIMVLLLWFPLKQKPGIGTILNALIIGLMIDVCIRYVPTPENFIYQILLGAFAVLTVGIGGGIYLVANLGAGPRDGLMIGLQKKTNFPISKRLSKFIPNFPINLPAYQASDRPFSVKSISAQPVNLFSRFHLLCP